MTKRLLSILFLSFFAFSIIGQSELNKGSVKMEITDIKSDNEQMAMQLEMMKGSQTDVFFNGGNYASHMNMMGGMVSVKTFTNPETNTFDLLMDAMGQKMWVNSKLDESANVMQKEAAEAMEVKYDKSDTKTILGYECYKVSVANPNAAEGITVEGYITEEIKTDANIIQGLQTLKFDGFTLEFTVKNPLMTMTMTAIEVNDDFEEANLIPETEGFKKMTMEEFRNSMGGIGGF